ncbi:MULTISPECIES: hypothetical protein [unclassified Brevundimonas]|uniref:hypothetical protein n=1 Tax=unclassified Brevundimonas TaxID=2622653 RepID=UPI0025BBED0C|nr:MULTISPECIES: hypothetical protein [unclassified Brevundimonas]
MSTSAKRVLDQNEQQWVEQSKKLDGMSHRELTELARQLRSRRERVQRMMRDRARAARRSGENKPDTGAREKKELLVAAIERVNAALEARSLSNSSSRATENLREAVERKAKAPAKSGPKSRTANKGPAETPNEKIAPSGALHAEGMRASMTRSTGNR